jgi:hypothetical protein
MSSGPFQFLPLAEATQNGRAPGPGATGSPHIDGRIANHDAVRNRHLQSFRSQTKRLRVRFQTPGIL